MIAAVTLRRHPTTRTALACRAACRKISVPRGDLPVGHYGGGVDEAGAGRRRQNEVYRAGVFGRTPRVPVAARALQKRARRVLDARAYSYVAGGAGAEATQRANRAAFDRWAVVPRVLRD